MSNYEHSEFFTTLKESFFLSLIMFYVIYGRVSVRLHLKKETFFDKTFFDLSRRVSVCSDQKKVSPNFRIKLLP